MQGTHKLILASASARRRQLLPYLCPAFGILVADCDERGIEADWRSTQAGLELRSPEEQLLSYEGLGLILARTKALASARRAQQEGLDFDYILASDTMVLAEGRSLAKPRNRTEALSMLNTLQGREHCVLTSVYLLSSTGEAWGNTERALVYFAARGPEALAAYVDRVQPYDKAGAYSISDPEADFVSALDGHISTVMGLGLDQTWKLLDAQGLASHRRQERRWTRADGSQFRSCLEGGQLRTELFIGD